MNKTDPESFMGVKYLRVATQVVAWLLCVAIIVASLMLMVDVFVGLAQNRPESALQEGLFVLILLEMFFVIRSFIKYGSINVGLIISVGMIAAVKELVFKLDSLDIQMAIAFAVVFLALSIGYFMEILHFKKKKQINDIFVSIDE